MRVNPAWLFNFVKCCKIYNIFGIHHVDKGGFGGDIVDREKAVRVRARVVEKERDESRRLVSETVVVLAPAGAGRKKLGGRNGFTPFDCRRLLEKLDVLHNLRSDDRKEGFIARHGRRLAVHEVANHTSKESVLREHLHNTPVRSFW